MSPPRPTFLVLGPGKCGTTWMYRLLERHPEVGTPVSKETMYFDHYYDRGLSWYLKQFPSDAAYSQVGEVSNTYFFSPEAARRIAETVPEAKLLCSLRDPVERAFSHYLLLYRNGQVRGGFRQAADEFPEVLEAGLYHKHLERYLTHFGRDQIKIMDFELLKRSNRAFARSILDFIGVDSDFFPEELDEKVLPAQKPRSWLVSRVGKAAAVLFRDFGLHGIVQRIKDSSITDRLYEPFSDDEYPSMDSSVRADLRTYYRRDTRQLVSNLGVSFARKWSSVTDETGD